MKKRIIGAVLGVTLALGLMVSITPNDAVAQERPICEVNARWEPDPEFGTIFICDNVGPLRCRIFCGPVIEQP